MDLHHQSVVQAHRRHFGQHLRPEEFGVRFRRGAGYHAGEQRPRIGGRKICGRGARMSVVGRRGAVRLEKVTALVMRGEIAGPGRRVFAGDGAELGDVVAKAGERRVDDRVRPVVGDDAPLPARLANGFVPTQIVQCALGSGDDLDVELFEQRARPEFGALQRFGDDVVIPIGVRRRQALGEAEQVLERMVEPKAGRRAGKETVVLSEQSPDVSRIDFDRTTVNARNAEVLHRYALAVEHAKHIMVRRHEQLRGIGKRLVLREPARVGMTMRRYDR